jgi:hypothetical protein
MLMLGVTVGVVVCVGSLVGYLVGRYAAPAGGLAWPESVLQASATESSDSMAIATGMIADGVEGLFVLDFVTGNLQVWVINPLSGAWGGLYTRNVAADLGTQQGKAPKYLMVTGQAAFRSNTSNVRPAQSILYIADSTSGQFIAYMLPWNSQASTYNFAQQNPLIIIGRGLVRNLPIEGK